jgi:hypothetical protein
MPARRTLVGLGVVVACLLLGSTAPASAFTISGPGGAVPPPPASKVDPTMTADAKASAAYRKTIALSTWVSSPHAKAVVKRESGGNCKAVSPSGLYRGKWQLSAGFWKSYGGTRYASKADQASCAQQDTVAYRGWVASWWRPWGG